MAQQDIGMTIRRARERRRWTQRDLAEAVSVSRATVDAWENNRSYPRNRVGALEEVLGISLNGTAEAAPDSIVPEDDLEAAILADDDLPDRIKRRFIADRRESHAARDARRQTQAAAEDGRPGRHRAS